MNWQEFVESRRAFLTTGAGLAAAAAVGNVARAEETPVLKSELISVAEAELDTGQQIGTSPQGTRNIVYVKSGIVTGKVAGKILPGGGDWLLVRPDGIGEIDVRATMEADDGSLIYTHYRGVLNFQTGYFRTTPRYETASEKYKWLNDIVAVGVGESIPTGVRYHIYRIL
jgi:hypothetical protein